MEKVVILGSAFPAIHLSTLLQTAQYDVRVVDTHRNPVPSSVPYSRIDDWSISKLSPHLKGVESVILIVPFDIPLENVTHDMEAMRNEQIVSRIEHSLDAILHSKVRRLIYLGDAYSSLPVDDNYGISEQKHLGIPSSFLLGSYGEALCRAELTARNRMKEKSSISSIFLRPVMCAENPWFDRLAQKASKGEVPFIRGNRRSQHQFVALHNILQLIQQVITVDRTTHFSLEFCMIHFSQYLLPSYVMSVLLSRCPSFALSETSFISAFATHLKAHLFHSYSLSAPSSLLLPLPTFRLLFDKTVGFSNRKQRLLLNFVPTEEPIQTMKKRAPPMRMG
ncbi:hypothetical protein PFISCL1PPCAC_5680 [Pristionchus fissidentatus]|uniref:NAD(P)-binding domain-containing protein n=1 Tax=Pristionchus fissidentatus TaxID=1538716 RepID=A0AAV5V825_9BILA|nr:hypothetical protein PFISCL1PPCAC_5680 [Pristionchus fissidentatus]